MVRWRMRQLAAKRARQNYREEPLPHGPGSQWTEPPDACTSASGEGAGAAPPFSAENGQRMTCEPPRTAQGLASPKDLAFSGGEPAEGRFLCSARAAARKDRDPRLDSMRKAGPRAGLANRKPSLRQREVSVFLRASGAWVWPGTCCLAVCSQVEHAAVPYRKLCVF